MAKEVQQRIHSRKCVRKLRKDRKQDKSTRKAQEVRSGRHHSRRNIDSAKESQKNIDYTQIMDQRNK